MASWEDLMRQKIGQPVEDAGKSALMGVDDKIAALRAMSQRIQGEQGGLVPQEAHQFTPQEQALHNQALAAQKARMAGEQGNLTSQDMHMKQLDQMAQNIDPQMLQNPPKQFAKLAQKVQGQKPVGQKDIQQALGSGEKGALTEEDEKSLFPDKDEE